MKFILVFTILIFLSKVTLAEEGCLVGNTVYPNIAGYSSVNLIPLLLGTKIFYATSPYSTSEQTCPGWAHVNSSTGSCIYGTPTLGANLGGYQVAICVSCPTGTLVDYTYINCDLDGDTLLFGAAAGLFGIFVIRKRNKL